MPNIKLRYTLFIQFHESKFNELRKTYYSKHGGMEIEFGVKNSGDVKWIPRVYDLYNLKGLLRGRYF